MPDLVQIAARFAPHGVRVLGVTGAPAERVEPFRQQTGAGYPILTGAWASFGDYGVRSVPVNYLVDPEGRIVASGLEDAVELLAERFPG